MAVAAQDIDLAVLKPDGSKRALSSVKGTTSGCGPSGPAANCTTFMRRCVFVACLAASLIGNTASRIRVLAGRRVARVRQSGERPDAARVDAVLPRMLVS